MFYYDTRIYFIYTVPLGLFLAIGYPHLGQALALSDASVPHSGHLMRAMIIPPLITHYIVKIISQHAISASVYMHFYFRNKHDDVVAIVGSNGSTVVQHKYDA